MFPFADADAIDATPLPSELELNIPLPSDPMLDIPFATGIGGGGSGVPIKKALIENDDLLNDTSLKLAILRSPQIRIYARANNGSAVYFTDVGFNFV